MVYDFDFSLWILDLAKVSEACAIISNLCEEVRLLFFVIYSVVLEDEVIVVVRTCPIRLGSIWQDFIELSNIALRKEYLRLDRHRPS